MKAIYKNLFPLIENQRFKLGRSQGAWSYEVAQEQIAAQKEENALDRDWNTNEAEKARSFDMMKLQQEQAFANAQRLASQEYQSDEWTRQFNMQNEYNTPAQQAGRLRAIGINPQVALSGDSAKVVTGSSVSAPSGSSPSSSGSPMASGHHGLSPVPFTPGTNLAQDLSQVAGALDSFGKAVGQGLENTVAAKSLQSMVDLKAAQSMGQQLINEGQKTANSLSRIRLKSEDQMIAAKLTKLVNEGLLAKSQGVHFDKLAQLDEAQTDLVQTLSDKYGYEGQLAAMQVLTFMDQWRADMGYTRAKTSEASANASLAGARAQTEDALRQFIVDIKQAESDEAKRQNLANKDSFKDRYDAILADAVKNKLMNQAEVNHMNVLLQRYQDALDARNSSAIAAIADDIVTYVTDKIGVTLGGSVSAFSGHSIVEK